MSIVASYAHVTPFGSVDLEQFGMQRSAVELKNQLGDFRSNSQHEIATFR